MWNGEKTKEKNKKGGIGCGHLPPYPAWAASPVAQRCNGRWSFGLSIRWCNMLWSCFVLCASVPSRMGGTCARICVERGVGGIVAITPVVVEVWTSWWWNDRGHVWIRARFPCSCSLCTVMFVPSAGMGAAVRAPVAPRLAKGLHVSLRRGRSMPRGSDAPVLTLQGSGESEIVLDRAQGSGALMTSWGLGRGGRRP
jgi:hypothetical protein